MNRAPFTPALLIFILRSASVNWHVGFSLTAYTCYNRAHGVSCREVISLAEE